MKSFSKYMIGLAALTTLAACSPEEFKGADPNGVPTVDGLTMKIEVDQETNTMTASVPEVDGQWPVWYLDGRIYSSLPKISFSAMEQGTHTLSVRVGNRNGFSNASINDSFTFNETKIDYSPYFARLTGKEWRIDYAEKGHMGCGESGTDGSNWWSAGVNEKADWGVYDDRITFGHTDADGAAGGTYTYNPGEGGTVYINYGCSIYPEYNTEKAAEKDFMAPVSPQNSKFTIEPGTWNDEECLYITFDPHTLLPYIPNDDMWENPRYRVEALTNTRLVLVHDNGGIAWRLVFTSREDSGLPDEPETPDAVFDWDPTSSANLWLPVEEGRGFESLELWFADNGWGQIASPNVTHENSEWSFVVPEGIGSSQWQGQVKIHTNVSLQASKKYDVFLMIESDNDMPGVTIKPTQDGDDGNFLTADQHAVTADKPFIYKGEALSLAAGNDAEKLMFVFDFGGAPAGTNVKISKIYIAEAVDMSYDSADNLWKTVDDGPGFVGFETWFADNGWGELANQPTITHNGNTYEFDVPEGTGGSQWQGQLKIHTLVPAEAASLYNFSCTIEGDNDMPAVTIKFTQDGDDGNFFFADQHKIVADKPYVYKAMNVGLSSGADAEKMMMVFDFGGTPGGTHVKISNIVFKKAI